MAQTGLPLSKSLHRWDRSLTVVRGTGAEIRPSENLLLNGGWRSFFISSEGCISPTGNCTGWVVLQLQQVGLDLIRIPLEICYVMVAGDPFLLVQMSACLPAGPCTNRIVL